MADPEDDLTDEWGQPFKTVADPAVPPGPAGDQVTAPHQIAQDIAAAFEAGRRQGFSEGFPRGQDDAIGALLEVFGDFPGGIDDGARAVVARVRKKLTPV